MYLNTNLLSLFLLVVLIRVTYGFRESCAVNHTLFVPVGRDAAFIAEDIAVARDGYIFLNKFENKRRPVLFIEFVKENSINVSVSHVLFYAKIENSTTVKMEFSGKPDMYTFTVVLQNTSTNYNGTYYINGFFPYENVAEHCWILLSIDMQKTSSGPIAENSAVRIYGNPSESIMVRPLVNATMMWLLDGVYVNQTTNALAQDGVLWIVYVGRQLHGRNVTYRAVQDNGDVHEANFTLEVAYGPAPTFTLIFTPENTHYSLKSGETLPDISCHVDCNPPCKVTWGRHSSNNTLRLGRVSPNSTGMYTCVANSSLTTVSRSLYVYVVDEWTMILSPPTTAYFLSAGDSVSDINCSALCFPPCITTWNRKSTGNILRLGAVVTTEISGEYVCTATRNDTDKQMEKTVMIFVTVSDDGSTRAALIVVGSIQACTTVALGLCGLLYCFRRRGMSCSNRHQSQQQRKELKGKEGTANNLKGDDTELESYEELDLGRGNQQLYDQAVPEQTRKNENKKLEVYENTVVA